MSQAMPQARVRVTLPESGERSYEVVIGEGLLGSLGLLVRAAVGEEAKRCALVLDEGVMARGVDPQAAIAAAGFSVTRIVVPPGEESKSFASLERVLRELARARLERTDLVVAVGGGVVGDLAGFAAAVHRRGVAVVQCPTTLLAMVDAAVGGKTGVNLVVGPPGGEVTLKNAVGAFHQPRGVVVDTAVLRTLPPRHLAAGLAECIKHAMIEPTGALWAWTEANLSGAAARAPGVVGDLIARNVAFKAGVVAADEREEAPDEVGGRALLNLGHTFGHVLEVLDGLSDPLGHPFRLLHGEAVGLGLRAASAAARAAGLVDDQFVEGVAGMVQAAGLPAQVRGLPGTPALVSRMGDDKKARGGRVRVVLPVGRGLARVVSNPDPAVLAAGFDAIRA